jgi:hypothetical protein
MAVSPKSALIGFFALVVFYGMYQILIPFINNFAGSHSSVFNIVLVVLIPIIIVIGIIVYIFSGESEVGYMGGYR